MATNSIRAIAQLCDEANKRHEATMRDLESMIDIIEEENGGPDQVYRQDVEGLMSRGVLFHSKVHNPEIALAALSPNGIHIAGAGNPLHVRIVTAMMRHFFHANERDVRPIIEAGDTVYVYQFAADKNGDVLMPVKSVDEYQGARLVATVDATGEIEHHLTTKELGGVSEARPSIMRELAMLAGTHPGHQLILVSLATVNASEETVHEDEFVEVDDDNVPVTPVTEPQAVDHKSAAVDLIATAGNKVKSAQRKSLLTNGTLFRRKSTVDEGDLSPSLILCSVDASGKATTSPEQIKNIEAAGLIISDVVSHASTNFPEIWKGASEKPVDMYFCLVKEPVNNDND